MLIWFILFFAVLVISFILAYRSMRDYIEKPSKLVGNYSVFLIQNTAEVTEELLQKLHKLALEKSQPVSFEQLFRGQRRALVVYAPVEIMKDFKSSLGLVELEDYSLRVKDDQLKSVGNILSWEVGLKHQIDELDNFNPIQSYVPTDLKDLEEVWWQVIIQPLQKSEEKTTPFLTVIRVFLEAESEQRAKEIQDILLQIGHEKSLSMLPQALPVAKQVRFYQERAMVPVTGSANPKGLSLVLSAKEVLNLLGI